MKDREALEAEMARLNTRLVAAEDAAARGERVHYSEDHDDSGGSGYEEEWRPEDVGGSDDDDDAARVYQPRQTREPVAAPSQPVAAPSQSMAPPPARSSQGTQGGGSVKREGGSSARAAPKASQRGGSQRAPRAKARLQHRCAQ